MNKCDLFKLLLSTGAATSADGFVKLSSLKLDISLSNPTKHSFTTLFFTTQAAKECRIQSLPKKARSTLSPQISHRKR